MDKEKHFAIFYSPGTFVAETSSHEIVSWDIEAAKLMATEITERYGAKPYAFQFTTRTRTDEDFDSKETARSGMYYINCEVLTYSKIKKRGDAKDEILLSNMKANGWEKVVRTLTGWQWTQPLKDGDVVL